MEIARHFLTIPEDPDIDVSKPATEYWKKAFLLKTDTGIPAFPNLKKVVDLIFILSFSNGSVDRVFSELIHCKSVERKNLKTDTVVALMATKEGINEQGGFVAFEPNKAMLKCNIWQRQPEKVL